MVVINKKGNCDLTFEELHVGTAFKSENRYCIKTDMVYQDSSDLNATVVIDAVDLTTGEHILFDSSAPIEWIAEEIILN